MSRITKVEIIDEHGRSYTNSNRYNKVSYQITDGGATLRVNITNPYIAAMYEQQTSPPQDDKSEPFFVFFVSDYFATGEGQSINILVERNYDKGRSLQKFINFVGSYYAPSVEELSEEAFLERYSNLLPPALVSTIERKTVPGFEFLQSYHFNYS